MTNDIETRPSPAQLFEDIVRWSKATCIGAQNLSRGVAFLRGMCTDKCGEKSCRVYRQLLMSHLHVEENKQEQVVPDTIRPEPSEATRHNSGKPKMSLMTPALWRQILYAPYSVVSPTMATAIISVAEIAHGKFTAKAMDSVFAAMWAEVDKTNHPLGTPYAFAETITRAMEFGVEKYGRDNWKLGFPLTTLCDSALRHLLKMAYKISEHDDESGVHHAGHVIFCFTNILHMLGKPELIDRFDDSGALRSFIKNMNNLK